MVGEEEDVGFLVDPEAAEGVEDAADIPIEVFDHGAVAGDIEPGLFLNPRDFGNIAAELDFGRFAGSAIGRMVGRNVGTVGRLDGEGGKKRLVFAVRVFGADVIGEVLDKAVGKGIGFVAIEPNRFFATASMDITLVLIVIVFVAQPVIEAAAAVWRDDIGSIGAIEVPFADIGGMVAGLAEGSCDGGDFGVERGRGFDDAVLMGVGAGEEGTSERGAPWSSGDRAVVAPSLAGEVIEDGRIEVGIVPVAEGLGAVLIAEDPDNVGSVLSRHGDKVWMRGGKGQWGN